MAYIGNTPATRYTTITKQTITGGGNTSYVLNSSVSSDQDIEVFVNNVRQEPGVAYTASGTTLNMTGVVNANDSFYVVYQGKAQSTVNIPEKQASGDYNFDNGTLYLDSANDRIGIRTTTPTSNLHVVGTANVTNNFVVGGTLSVGGYNISPTQSFRNKIINGTMYFDQRNAGASVTPTGSAYTLDRWSSGLTQASKYSVQQNKGSITPPAGFVNYLGVTSLSSYSVGASDTFSIEQPIEGLNCIDVAFGTANAKPVTLSFYAYSSLTGTFGGSICNGTGTRSYPFTYSVGAANTWTYITKTIPGDTTGTWYSNTSTGIIVRFGLGSGSTYSGVADAWVANNHISVTGATSVVGTNGATFYLTGVQLETGSVATPFEQRPYGLEYQLCQRYYQKYTQPALRGVCYSSTNVSRIGMQLPIAMRGNPTTTMGAMLVWDGGASATITGVVGTYTSAYQVEYDLTVSGTALTPGRGISLYQSGTESLILSSEL